MTINIEVCSLRHESETYPLASHAIVRVGDDGRLYNDRFAEVDVCMLAWVE